MSKKKDYGFVSEIHSETGQEKKIKITQFVRANYVDNRLISVLQLEDNTTIINITNPESSDRAADQTMRLTQQSLIGVHATMAMYLTMSKTPVEELLKENGDLIDYSCSDNLEKI